MGVLPTSRLTNLSTIQAASGVGRHCRGRFPNRLPSPNVTHVRTHAKSSNSIVPRQGTATGPTVASWQLESYDDVIHTTCKSKIVAHDR